MGRLFEQVRHAVAQGRYLVGAHAANQMEARGIMDWQVIDGVSTGVLLRERPGDTPNPVIEVEQSLPDGTSVKAVRSWLPVHQVAKLVTVHYLDR